MLRIAICCGGGFSSSTMAAHLNKQLKEKQLEGWKEESDKEENDFIDDLANNGKHFHQ